MSDFKKKIHDAFETIHADSSLKEKTKSIIAEKAAEQKKCVPKEKSSFRKRIIPVAVGGAATVCGIAGWGIYVTPVAAVSLDVNPSIEIQINCFDKVISVEGYNDDGKKVADRFDYKNMNYHEALDSILNSSEIISFISEGEEVYVTVTGESEQKREEIYSDISACEYKSITALECDIGSNEEVRKAHEAGLSVGKYRKYIQLHTLDSEVTVEDVKNMTMKQIHESIDELSGNANGNGYNESGGKHKGINGNNNGAGNGNSYKKRKQ